MPSNAPSPSRRRLLQSIAAVLGASALAGCGGSGSASGTARAGPNVEPPQDALTDPTHVSLRNSELAPIVEDPDSETDASESDTAGTPRFDDWQHDLVVDAERAGSLTFADVDGADEARALLDETDFESESVYVEGHVVPECYERRLCWVRWTDSEIETDYARILRDADVACEADADDFVTNLIRIPAALNPDDVRSYGSSSGSGPCRRPAGERTEGESA
ncbi:hypothetical protein [Halobellus litoreus]|uniref:Uncharacterized protein n=1 Tax=Halobellus litoreus TaxID=755310 RepID=A0ABD6DVK1_9EURY|nr:hypothetical protein [Halobellus litoreus]